MATKLTRRPNRAAVDRVLRGFQTLWKPPDKNDKGRGQAAYVGTDQRNELHLDHTPVAPGKRGAL